jgi:hypothetical protein
MTLRRSRAIDRDALLEIDVVAEDDPNKDDILDRKCWAMVSESYFFFISLR